MRGEVRIISVASYSLKVSTLNPRRNAKDNIPPNKSKNLPRVEILVLSGFNVCRTQIKNAPLLHTLLLLCSATPDRLNKVVSLLTCLSLRWLSAHVGVSCYPYCENVRTLQACRAVRAPVIHEAASRSECHPFCIEYGKQVTLILRLQVEP